MPEIVISKTGGVLYWPDALKKRSSLADVYPAPAVVRFVMDHWGERVTYLGRWQGTPPKNFTGVMTDLSKVNEWDDEAQIEAIEKAAEEVVAIDGIHPKVWIELGGSTPTTSLVDNPRNVSTLMSAARYVGVPLGVCAKLAMTRINICTDVRCYPKNFEMTFGNHLGYDWDSVVPRAVLSQEKTDFTRKICSDQWRIHAADGSVEFWPTYGLSEVPSQLHRTENENPLAIIIAHSHMNDPRWSNNRDVVWCRIFRWLEDGDIDWQVYGDHWEYCSMYESHRSHFKGKIPVTQVADKMLEGDFGVMMPPSENWGTAKPRLYARLGIPCLVWNGEPQPYPEKQGFPRNHAWRFSDAEDYDDVIHRILHHEYAELNLINTFRDTTPDFSKLVSCVEELCADHKAWLRDNWFEEYGGYLPL